jgi:hypothetical protein
MSCAQNRSMRSKSDRGCAVLMFDVNNACTSLTGAAVLVVERSSQGFWRPTVMVRVIFAFVLP